MPDFNSEATMYPYIKRYLQEEGFITFPQFFFRGRLADFIAIKPNLKAIRERIQQATFIPLLNIFQLRVLLQLSENRNNVSLDGLANTLKVSKNYVKRTLRQLCKLGFIDDNLQVIYLPPLTFTEIIALEVKLKKWKECITQVYRYRWFADKLYIALPYSFAYWVATNHQSVFKRKGIGLYAVNGEMEELLPSQSFKHHPFYLPNVYCLSEFVAYKLIRSLGKVFLDYSKTLETVSSQMGWAVEEDELRHLLPLL